MAMEIAREAPPALAVAETGMEGKPHAHKTAGERKASSRRVKRKAKLSKAAKESMGDDELWDHFYSQKGVRFYKDRHWLRRELLELMPPAVRDDPMRWCAPLASDGTGVAVDVVPWAASSRA